MTTSKTRGGTCTYPNDYFPVPLGAVKPHVQLIKQRLLNGDHVWKGVYTRLNKPGKKPKYKTFSRAFKVTGYSRARYHTVYSTTWRSPLFSIYMAQSYDSLSTGMKIPERPQISFMPEGSKSNASSYLLFALRWIWSSMLSNMLNNLVRFG